MSSMIGQPEPVSSTVLRHGVAQLVDGVLTLAIDGAPQPGARWARGYVPTVGDAVAVLVTSGPTGQSSALALCAMSATTSVTPPDEGVVSAVPASSPTITVTAGGTTYTAKIVGPAPAVGDRVLLDHRPGAVYVVGKIGATPAPPAPTPPPTPPTPPPGGPTSGSSSFGAIDSATARAGSGWNTPSGQTVIQGSYGGVAYAGSWFYGTGPSSLAGRGIAGARIYLSARRRMGSWSTAVVIRLWGHSSATRPGGDVSRTTGPHDITLPAGWGGGWVPIPVALAQVVVAGGGLGIAGGSYAGLDGRDADPQSGTVAIDWTT